MKEYLPSQEQFDKLKSLTKCVGTVRIARKIFEKSELVDITDPQGNIILNHADQEVIMGIEGGIIGLINDLIYPLIEENGEFKTKTDLHMKDTIIDILR